MSMRFAGKTQQFLGDVLPLDFRPEIFRLIEAAWRCVPNPRAARLEPRITGLLQRRMIVEQESVFKTDPPFYILEDVKKRDPETGKERERSDLEVHLRHHSIKGQKPYFVFESKRLNISYGNAVSSNASEYVGDGGMGCLLAGGYETVPDHSGMLGFVMDGNVAAAKKSIEAQLVRKSKELQLHGEPKIHSCTLMPKSDLHGETHHTADAKTQTMFHILLAANR